MSAVERIKAALAEREALLDATHPTPWKKGNHGIYHEQGGWTTGVVIVRPRRIADADVALIVAAVNQQRAQIQHARDVLARHFPKHCCPPERREDCPYPSECVRCPMDEEHDYQPWPCAEVASLLAVWCPS